MKIITTPAADSLTSYLEELLAKDKVKRTSKCVMSKFGNSKNATYMLTLTYKGSNWLGFFGAAKKADSKLLQQLAECLEIEFYKYAMFGKKKWYESEAISLAKLLTALPTRKNVIKHMIKTL